MEAEYEAKRAVDDERVVANGGKRAQVVII
jgi:hypothetical protein